MFFERAQDFCLRFKAHIPDFIKEERAAVRSKEFAFFVRNCSWERSATMAEQLAFNEILRNCCAVYLYEHFILSRTVSVKDRKSTRLNSSHTVISYAVFCLKKKK